MNNVVQVRIENKTKKAVAKIFDSLGLDLSSGIKIYFNQVILHQGIPFPLLTENGFTAETEEKILREAAKTEKRYKSKNYLGAKSMKQLIDELTK